VFEAQHDVPHAIADYSRAIALAPKEARYRVQRAEAYLVDHRRTEALADLDAAIALDPANLPALLDRGALRVEDKKFDEAIRDADAAAHAAAPTIAEHMQIAGLYEAAHDYGPAIDQLGLWIDSHRTDAHLPEALNARCWVRALANRDLDAALDDCNAALRLAPHTPSFLDSRGLVRVRMGQWDKAIADYDEALKLSPKIAWSLYGRGIARRHKGLAAQGDADIAAAAAIDKELSDEAKKAGIS
jgi:tetratricopeptide (TPR) repeat protein